MVGYFERRKLLFAGKVGTGSNTKTRKSLIGVLTAIKRIDDPFGETPNQYVKWTGPRMVVEVDFVEFTGDGLLRHPAFRGVREDKKADEVKLEGPREVPPPGVISSSKTLWRRTR